MKVAPFTGLKCAFSRCHFAPATEGVIGSVVGQRASGEAHVERGGTQGEALTGCELTFHTASLLAPRMHAFTAGADHEGGAFS